MINMLSERMKNNLKVLTGDGGVLNKFIIVKS